MDLNEANIEKEENEYVWRGHSNLKIYEREFEAHLILKVFLLFTIIVSRGVL